MRKARWLADWRESTEKPVFYHCISRVVERRFAFGPEEKEKFRALMRIQEKFAGCRVVAYCLMCNHFHILLEVPPRRPEGLTDKELLGRLSAIYSEAYVAGVAKELADALELGMEKAHADIHARFSYRMHDLGEFMKGLLQRFTQWFNRTQARSGRLWEDRFKSVIVEDGIAAKTMAAYIDLNPVRAGIVKDPANYRWSSYGEAVGGGPKGEGRTARAGLVRALRAHVGGHADAGPWKSGVEREYRMFLMENAVERLEKSQGAAGGTRSKVKRKGISKADLESERARGGGIPVGKVLRCRIRYFTDGAVIGSRTFVDEAFRKSHGRFGSRRKDGARRPRGAASPMAGVLWTFRDLRVGIS